MSARALSGGTATGAADSAQEFSSICAPLQERIEALATQPASQTGVRRKRVLACDPATQDGEALHLLQWSMFRLADGRILFSDGEPLQIQGAAATLRPASV